MSGEDTKNGARALWKAGLFFLLVVFALTLIAHLMGANASQIHETANRSSEAIAPYRYALLAVRWAIFIAAWWKWGTIVEKLIPKSVAGFQGRRDALMGIRNRTIIAFVVLEVAIQIARI